MPGRLEAPPRFRPPPSRFRLTLLIPLNLPQKASWGPLLAQPLLPFQSPSILLPRAIPGLLVPPRLFSSQTTINLYLGQNA